MSEWSVEDSLNLYNIPHWGRGYFSINSEGEVVVRPNPHGRGAEVSLNKLAGELTRQGVTLPVLVRFPDILQGRTNRLCQAFNQAIKEAGYEGRYMAVYPIKVNQQRAVVQEILASQASRKEKQVGLEAGSKPEFMAVLAMARHANSVIVCNGYKDREYIRLALIGEKLGHEVYIVLEKLSELPLVIEESKRLGVTPRLGMRARLANQAKSKWESSGGEKSKFGLSATQVLQVAESLREHDMLGCLRMLHFHLGSQIVNIRDVRLGVKECAHLYAELRQQGLQLDCVDVGGGLGVDYEGTRSQSACSMNYSIPEYANNVVYTLRDVCRERRIPMPRIMSESGRSLSAYHAVLITDVQGCERFHPATPTPPKKDSSKLLQSMWDSWLDLVKGADSRALVEIFNDTQSDLAEVHTLFGMGMIGLQERAWAEQINLTTCLELSKRLNPHNRAHRSPIDDLNEKLADKLFLNFSIFQSLPDAWSIDQVFPVLPLSHLDKKPDRRAVLFDITCDSDGIIDQYVDGQGIETTLPVPAWTPQHPYLIGFFLVGAYQEILGDLHNLFGDTDTVVVRHNEKGETVITEIEPGDTVEDVLGYVNLETKRFLQTYRQLVRTTLPRQEQREVLAELEAGLRGYTYLEDIGDEFGVLRPAEGAQEKDEEKAPVPPQPKGEAARAATAELGEPAVETPSNGL